MVTTTEHKKSLNKVESNPDDTREKRFEILNSLTEGDKVFCQQSGRYGIYKGIQELAMPDAWVLFDDKQIHEPVNPLNLIKQPTWKEGDKVIHETLGKGVISKLTGIASFVNFEAGEQEVTVYHSKNALMLESEHSSSLPSAPCFNSNIKVGDEVTTTDLPDVYKVIHIKDGQASIRHLNSANPDNNPVPLVRQLPLWHLNKVESTPSYQKVEKTTPTPAQKVSLFEIPNNLDGESLSKEDVEKLIELIVENSESIEGFARFAKNFTRYALVVIDAREGYKAYDCASMSQFLENYHHLFKKAYSSLQKEWQAGKLEYDLRFSIGTLPETQAREFYPLRDNIEDCRKAWELACEVAKSENRKVKASDIGAAVREIGKLPEPHKKIKTKCGWVAGPNATRHYRVKIFESEVNLHDTYDSAARTIIDIAQARKQAPEELIVEGLIGALSELLGVSNAGAVAAAVNFLKKEEA
ncbi:MAG: hypothetical protein KME29_31675 [Calothrix sp. FI2-JRJ7]|jgi:hypothetical protein|nr:hypothetical protein [Calothrix sp. FI2-JRJ7]